MRQATAWLPLTSNSGGTDVLQMPSALTQRVWKRQPGGGLIGFGGSPLSGGVIVRSAGSILGIEARSAEEYGCLVLSKIALLAPISATLPRYITMTRSARKRTTLRSCEMKM